MTGGVEELARELGWRIPDPPSPQGSYLPWTIHGNMVFTSGMGPLRDGKRAFVGRVGENISLDEAQVAARLCVLSGLGSLRAAIGGLDRVERILRITGYVRVAEGFVEIGKVLDGASDVLVHLFGERGRHVRTAVGVCELPFAIPVEVDLVAAVRPESAQGGDAI